MENAESPETETVEIASSNTSIRLALCPFLVVFHTPPSFQNKRGVIIVGLDVNWGNELTEIRSRK